MYLSHRTLIPLGLISSLTIASEIQDTLVQDITLALIVILSFIAIGMVLQQEQ